MWMQAAEMKFLISVKVCNKTDYEKTGDFVK
jgi:hypothetical protein